MTDILIYLPAYNEAERIEKTIQNLPTHLPGVDRIEVLVVDDGSTDDTASLASSQGARVVSHSHNFGVGKAFHTAVEEAIKSDADVLVSIDADGQFDARDIPRLIQPLAENKADFVTGDRFSGADKPQFMSGIKYWGNKRLAHLISAISGVKLRDVACGFRAYNREVLFNLNIMGRFTYTQETILDIAYKGFRIAQIPISVEYFEDRKSRVAGSIRVYAINSLLIIARSFRDYKPLRFFGWMGLTLLGLGSTLCLGLLIRFLFFGSFTPYKFVGVVGGVLIGLGVVIVVLALVADMLDRIRANQEKILYHLKKERYSGDTR